MMASVVLKNDEFRQGCVKLVDGGPPEGRGYGRLCPDSLGFRRKRWRRPCLTGFGHPSYIRFASGAGAE